MTKIMKILASTASLLMLCTSSFAHHGVNSEYDSSHPITLKGTVTEYAFSNPHIQIYFDVKDAKGQIVHWGCEGPSPGRLIRDGWPRNATKPGDQVTIMLDPARSGAPVGALRKIVLPDGKVLSVVPLVPQQ
jgi:hypothetical protein